MMMVAATWEGTDASPNPGSPRLIKGRRATPGGLWHVPGKGSVQAAAGGGRGLFVSQFFFRDLSDFVSHHDDVVGTLERHGRESGYPPAESGLNQAALIPAPRLMARDRPAHVLRDPSIARCPTGQGSSAAQAIRCQSRSTT